MLFFLFLLALQFLLIVQPLKHVALTYYHALQCVLKKKKTENKWKTWTHTPHYRKASGHIPDHE